MSEEIVDLRADGEHRYLAVVRDGAGTQAQSRIVVPQRFIDSWGLTQTDEPQVVRASLELLTKHEIELPAEFTLDDETVAYQGFTEDLQLALGY